MKTILNFKPLLLIIAVLLFFSCGNKWRGSAADTTGTNGATNGTGKTPKSENIHNHSTN